MDIEKRFEDVLQDECEEMTLEDKMRLKRFFNYGFDYCFDVVMRGLPKGDDVESKEKRILLIEEMEQVFKE